MTDPRAIPAAVREAARDAAGRAASAVDAAKPKLRGWLHAATSPIALVAGIVLVVLAPTWPATAAAAAYAATSVVLFTVSAVYHRGRWSPRVAGALKRVDHASIYLLIAGTYTPFAALALHGAVQVAVLTVVWVTAAFGVVFRVVWPGAPRWFYVTLYVALGWTAAFVFPELVAGAGVAAFTLVAVGGGLYTLGAVVYGLRRPDPWPRWFGFHEIFHALTVAAFACQYVAASLVVYRAV